MVADGNSLYIAAAAGRPAHVSSGSHGHGAGRVTLFEYDISAGTFTDTRIEPELNELNQLYRFDNGTADNERMGFRFGASVDMVSGRMMKGFRNYTISPAHITVNKKTSFIHITASTQTLLVVQAELS